MKSSRRGSTRGIHSFLHSPARLPFYLLGLVGIGIAAGSALTACSSGESGSELAQGVVVHGLDPSEPDYDLKLLGKYVFFDKISNPPRMACVTCHDPETGGTGSVSGVNLHQVVITGANPLTKGNLKPPTNAYASFIPPFRACNSGGLGANNYCGGNFWSGRAEGNGHPEDGGPGPVFPSGATKHIGKEIFQGLTNPPLQFVTYFGPTSDQALNPMPNKVEQNIERRAVCNHVASASYARLYKKVWGVAINCSDEPVAVSASDVGAAETQFDISFKRLMLAVGAWQHSKDLNSFSSKRDIALRAEIACMEGAPDADPAVCTHPNYLNSPGKFPLVGLTDQENLGHDLFYNRLPNPFAPPAPIGPPFNVAPRPDLPRTNCSFCHSDNPGPVGPGGRDDGSEPQQLYTAQDYHNIGTPANPEIPQLDPPRQPSPDLGIASHSGLDAPGLHRPGFFKTPTLRNVDKRKGNDFIKAYTHNGWFKSLESLVHFYNTGFVPGATAQAFGITRCKGTVTEKEALAHNCWPFPEFPNANDPSGNRAGALGSPLVGNLGMTADQEAALVAYLRTFTDTKTSKAPPPYK